MLARVSTRLAEQGIAVRPNGSKDRVVEEGTTPATVLDRLRRAIMRL